MPTFDPTLVRRNIRGIAGLLVTDSLGLGGFKSTRRVDDRWWTAQGYMRDLGDLADPRFHLRIKPNPYGLGPNNPDLRPLFVMDQFVDESVYIIGGIEIIAEAITIPYGEMSVVAIFPDLLPPDVSGVIYFGKEFLPEGVRATLAAHSPA